MDVLYEIHYYDDTFEPVDESDLMLPTSELKSGEIVTFGTYEQDNNTSNGKEEIEWIVLKTEGTKALVISKYALDCQAV